MAAVEAGRNKDLKVGEWIRVKSDQTLQTDARVNISEAGLLGVDNFMRA